MPRPVLALLATALAFAGPALGEPGGPSSRAGTVTIQVDLSAHPPGEEARLWLPYPTSDAEQVIRGVTVSGDAAESAVYTDRVHQTPVLYARWAPGAATRRLTLQFEVERSEVVRRDFPAREAPWDPADYALDLAATRLGPVDGEVKALADKITRGKTTVLARARAVYDWIVENTYRDPATRGCGPGDVCNFLLKPGGKCADIHSAYVALARAAGVPAREVFGVRLGKRAEEDVTGAQHCWAEFYLPGYGWVPVDPSDVRKAMLTEKLHLLDQRTDQLREYFFGAIEPHRVKLSRGRDLTLAPPQDGPPVNYLMYPFAQVGGRTLDWLDPQAFRYTITFRAR